MCKGGKRNSFLVGIRNGAWSLWNSNATGSYNYLSIPMAKQCYCLNNIFLLKNFCEIVTNLLEDVLHQDRACIVNSTKTGEMEAASPWQKVGLLRYCEQRSSPVGDLEQHRLFPLCFWFSNVITHKIKIYCPFFSHCFIPGVKLILGHGSHKAQFGLDWDRPAKSLHNIPQNTQMSPCLFGGKTCNCTLNTSTHYKRSI